MHNKSVIKLQDNNETDLEHFGGKTKNLYLLLKNGFPIPDTWIIPPSFFQYILTKNHLLNKVETLKQLIYHLAPTWHELANEIQAELLSLDIDMEDVRLLEDIYKKHPAVIVRSSVAEEDGSFTSMAGQYVSVVTKGVNNFIDALKICWASLFEASAVEFLLHRGIIASFSMAVIIQQWIEPRTSGISFSVVSKSGCVDIMTESTFGHGEMLVGGYIKPDRFAGNKIKITKKQFAVVSYESNQELKQSDLIPISFMGDGAYAHVLSLDRATQTAYIRLPGKIAELPSLDSNELNLIKSTITKISEKMGREVDTEWVIDHSGNLFIVQAREVTARIPEQSNNDENGYETASMGSVTGMVYVAEDAIEASLIQSGEILIVKSTTPDYMTALLNASGVISEEGGMLCHTAIVCRELGIPCLISVEGATSFYKSGETVTLDATNKKILRQTKSVYTTNKAKNVDTPKGYCMSPCFIKKIKNNTDILEIHIDGEASAKLNLKEKRLYWNNSKVPFHLWHKNQSLNLPFSLGIFDEKSIWLRRIR